MVRLLVGQERQHLRLRHADGRRELSGSGRAARGAGRRTAARHDAGSSSARRAPQEPARRDRARRQVLRGDARLAPGRPRARLSRRPRHRCGDAAQVPARLRASRTICAQGASRRGENPGRGHGGSGAPRRRRRYSGAVRPFPRPRHVSDRRLARSRHRVRRSCAREGRAGEISQLAGDAAVSQGRDALQHRGGAQGGARGRRCGAAGRGRRLYRRDRHGDRGLRGDRRAARHRAHRRPARADVADGRRADPLFRWRFRGPPRRLSRARTSRCR